VEGFRLIERIGLTNLLSFGPKGLALELEPLNVLIGPNASGKSNLIAALSLLHAVPSDLSVPIREGGGIAEWLWKGGGDGAEAKLEVVARIGKLGPVVHELRIEHAVPSTKLCFEMVKRNDGVLAAHPAGGAAGVVTAESPGGPGQPDDTPSLRTLNERELPSGRSLLSLGLDRAHYPSLSELADAYGRIAVYSDWKLGPKCPVRQWQPADMPADFLLPDALNVALVLNDLGYRGSVMDRIVQLMRRLNEGFDRVSVRVGSGMVQLFFHENGMEQPIPATRISDGTLRFLCLLSILCHPEPPPLICIEEPELGLHPDMIRTVAELLIEASQRAQLIVTTHSDLLVSALDDVPEAVVVFERGPNGSEARRLEPGKLRDWLKRYSLGEMWLSGELGGTRW